MALVPGVVMVVTVQREEVRIGPQGLDGTLEWVPDAAGLVIFAHGSGSSRRSPRNQLVADVLHGHHLDTLLFDLLTGAEASERRNVFDIGLLTQRVGETLEWAQAEPGLQRQRIGLFGASTGAAAALRAAAEWPALVSAVVSRGGRPDLAREYLPHVQAPTLLIIGGYDADVLALNRAAAAALRCRKRLEVVPAATHLFEEPGALDAVAQLAAAWFDNHLRDTPH